MKPGLTQVAEAAPAGAPGKAGFSLLRTKPLPGTQQALRPARGLDKIGARSVNGRMAATRLHFALLETVIRPGKEAFLILRLDGGIEASTSNLPQLLWHDSLLAIEAGALCHREVRWQGRIQASLQSVLLTGQGVTLVLPCGWGRSYRLGFSVLHPGLGSTARNLVAARIERCDIFDVPSVQTLQDVFSLTRAEASVYHYLVQGLAVRDIAQLGGVTQPTIRKQLVAVLRKTGCTRQAELMRLASLL